MNIIYGYHPVPKSAQLTRTRRTPNRANRGKFSTKTIKKIFERDNGRCVRCGTYQDLESVPHHIIFKSQGGKGTVDNGVTICRSCHREAHSKREVREWFEQYQMERLMNNGDT